MVKISIIIPVYNMEQYLRECLASCLSQTLKEIEIIAINDGSTDNSLSVLREYESKDNRIVVIDKENEGVGKARNDGILAAKGEFVAFMDSDDFYPSDIVLEKLYDAAKCNGVKIAGGRRIRLFQNGEEIYDLFAQKEKKLLFDANGLSDYNKYQFDYGYTQFIYNKQMLIDNNICFPDYKRFQDPPFFVKAMITAKYFYVDDLAVYCYRMVLNKAKYENKKTIDFLCGLSDNLKMSKEYNLPKLHYLSAMRLYEDASFMATQYLFEADAMELLEKIIRVVGLVDAEWLEKEGFELPKPFVPEVFQYAVSTAEKYERIRKKTIIKMIGKIRKKR